jgi:hypothetical protein
MVRYLFELLSKIYCIIFTKYENIFLKNKVERSNFQKLGYIKFSNLLASSINYSDCTKYKVNKYLKKIVFTEDRIHQILTDIFLKSNLKNHITNMTGLNYSIDYLMAYETSPILEKDRDHGWYANKLHKDKPFTENTLKIIIPLENIDEENGPMKIFNIELSKNILLNNNFNSENLFKFTGSNKDVFVFKPNNCFHVAGIPSKNKFRRQMMLQLNPAKNWRYNNQIHKFQKIREPKFPFFSYMLDKKIELI